MQSKKDRQAFIKQEYGWYSISSQGRRLEATPTNGIMIEYRTGEQHFRQQLSWAEVERHIVELVRQDVYLTEEETEELEALEEQHLTEEELLEDRLPH